ncbi:cupin domain-containing protein [Spirillospora sp. NPDC048911]|uniref:cupin domain-containing protein n=1 Tax=Spirillospora sp. NPDC048911 TaxID=3364527 RepID=UPI00371ABC2B
MNQDSCRVVRADDASRTRYDGKQAVHFASGVSRQSTGAQHLCLHRVVIPAGSRGEPHVHRDHESAVYVISGAHEVRFGDDLQERAWLEPGDFLYIPANVPHLPVNRGEHDAVVLVARTDASEQESVELIPWPAPLAELLHSIPAYPG